MSEAELHWLRQRLLGGKPTKAEQGELRFRLPVGLVYDLTGKVVLDPDEEVQAAVRLVFALFEQYGSALAVVKHFSIHHLRFPDRLWKRTQKGELVWELLRCGRVLSLLHNPFYAGAYVYGRTKTRRHALPGEAPRIKGRTRQVKLEDWPIVLRDAHPGYITWEQFRLHQQTLDDNRTWRPEERRGAVREGSALLQGIVLCGACGRRMTVRYLSDGNIPSYQCRQADAHQPKRPAKRCGRRHRPGRRSRVLGAIQPAQLAVALPRSINWKLVPSTSIGSGSSDWSGRSTRRIWPTVATTPSIQQPSGGSEPERDRNEKLTEGEQWQWEYEALPSPLPCGSRPRSANASWHLPKMSRGVVSTHDKPGRAQQSGRHLIRDVTLTKREQVIQARLRWQTEALTDLTVPRPKRAADARRTNPQVVARFVNWLPSTPQRRSRIGSIKKGGEQVWEAASPRARSTGSGLPTTFRSTAPKGLDPSQWATRRWTLLSLGGGGAAERERRPSDWCNAGRLECVSRHRRPRWITLTPEIIAELRKRVSATGNDEALVSVSKTWT